MKELQFGYFRGIEADQYSFYRVPKVLFTSEHFKPLSCEAKILYGLMLDRMSLSIKNRWLDEEDRVYIIFTVEEIMELLGCKTQKAVKLIKELDVETGIGLIEKRRLGLGKPNVIYVKNFMIKEVPEPESDMEEETTLEEEQPIQPVNSLNFENQNSRVSEIKNQEFPESKIQSFENQNSGSMKIKTLEFRKSKCNKTDINKTDINKTNPILSYPSDSLPIGSMAAKKVVIDKMDGYRELIRENISYDCFQGEDCLQKGEVDELVELMVETMLLPDEKVIRIAGEEKSAAIVKCRFMKLTYSHIVYVLGCLQKNMGRIGNIKAYLLTTLYNAALTIDNYYQATVNHDEYERK